MFLVPLSAGIEGDPLSKVTNSTLSKGATDNVLQQSYQEDKSFKTEGLFLPKSCQARHHNTQQKHK